MKHSRTEQLTVESAPAAITAEIKRIDPKVKPGSDEWVAYALLLGSAVWGPNPEVISQQMGISDQDEFISQMAERLVGAGIWKDGKVHANWFSSDGGGALSLILDARVALGLLTRG